VREECESREERRGSVKVVCGWVGYHHMEMACGWRGCGGGIGSRGGYHHLRQLEKVRAAAQQRLCVGELLAVGGEQTELDL